MDEGLRIWLIPLERPEHETTALGELLSETERQRAARFVFERDRRRYNVAHAALRQILSAITSQPPAAIVFEQTERGKPSLAGAHPAVQFNLAHSGKLAAVAVAAAGAGSHEIGVDIEQIRPLDDLLSLAEKNFSKTELAALLALPPEARPQAFFECWTRKEAFIKALGDGLYYPLDTFDVSLGEPARIERIQGQPASDWTLHAFTPAPGYTGAVAVHATAISEISILEWSMSTINV